MKSPNWSDGSRSNTAMDSLESPQSGIHHAPSSRRGKQKNSQYRPPGKHRMKTSSKGSSTMCQEESSKKQLSQLSIKTEYHSSDSSSTRFETFDECRDLSQSREPKDIEVKKSEELNLEENGNPSLERKEVKQESDCFPGSTEYHTFRGSVVGTKVESHVADIFVDGCPGESCVNDVSLRSIKEEPCENGWERREDSANHKHITWTSDERSKREEHISCQESSREHFGSNLSVREVIQENLTGHCQIVIPPTPKGSDNSAMKLKTIIVPNDLNVTHDGHVYNEFFEGKYGEDWLKREIEHEESGNQ